MIATCRAAIDGKRSLGRGAAAADRAAARCRLRGTRPALAGKLEGGNAFALRAMGFVDRFQSSLRSDPAAVGVARGDGSAADRRPTIAPRAGNRVSQSARVSGMDDRKANPQITFSKIGNRSLTPVPGGLRDRAQASVTVESVLLIVGFFFSLCEALRSARRLGSFVELHKCQRFGQSTVSCFGLVGWSCLTVSLLIRGWDKARVAVNVVALRLNHMSGGNF